MCYGTPWLQYPIVCVTPTLCLLLKAWGRVTEDKKKKKRKEKPNSSFEVLDVLTDKDMCFTSDISLTLFLPRFRACDVIFTFPYLSRSSWMKGYQKTQSPVAFSDHLTPADSSDLLCTSVSPPFFKTWSTLSFPVSLFPISRAFFSHTLMQSCEVTSFKPTLTYWPARMVMGGETASFFLVLSFNTLIHLHTFIYIYTKVFTPTHTSTISCIYTYICTHISYSILPCLGFIVSQLQLNINCFLV